MDEDCRHTVVKEAVGSKRTNIRRATGSRIMINIMVLCLQKDNEYGYSQV
jgi:hypothetical protein